MSLQDARLARENAKEVLRAGRDPSVQKKIEKLSGPKSSSTTFEEVARERRDMNKSHWTPIRSNDVIHSLDRDIFPHIGNLRWLILRQQRFLECCAWLRRATPRKLPEGYDRRFKAFLFTPYRLPLAHQTLLQL